MPAFDGACGGTRSAAFAYGVIRGLDRLPAGTRGTYVDRIIFISADTASVANALKNRDFTFVFGGDGASCGAGRRRKYGPAGARRDGNLG